MQTKAAYTIQCSESERTFPIVVILDSEKKAKDGVNSREVSCPLCDTILSFSLEETIAPPENILKSYNKAE